MVFVVVLYKKQFTENSALFKTGRTNNLAESFHWVNTQNNYSNTNGTKLLFVKKLEIESHLHHICVALILLFVNLQLDSASLHLLSLYGKGLTDTFET